MTRGETLLFETERRDKEIAELREKLAAKVSSDYARGYEYGLRQRDELREERDRLRQVISDARDHLHSVRIGKSIKPEESGTLRARLLLDKALDTPEKPPEEIKVGDWVEFGTGAKWRVLSLRTDSLGILKAGVGIPGLYATVLLSDCRKVEALAQPEEKV